MPDTPRNTFYLTTPIYYVNARPHIGHAYTTIVADVVARRHRLLGDDTYFLTGTDEHGQKIERSAAAAGIPPQQFADQVAASFDALWKRMGITNDQFIRTTDPRHQRGAQKLFQTLFDRGFIELRSYTGTYCVSDEAFVDVPVGAPCPECGRITESITEENFFFKLSEFQQPLIDLIESGTLSVEPQARRNEVLSFVRGGLKDLSISRSSFTWGVPVPEPAASQTKDKHVIYVWLDALANYMTAIGYGSDEPADLAKFEKYWPADLHLVGKEIIRFHCVYWPAFLLAAGLPLPKKIQAHGWLLFEESKMSKSRGNIVRTETILDAFGTLCPPTTELVILSAAKDPCIFSEAPQSPAPPTKAQQDLFAADILRYFLLREIPFGQDGTFSFDAMITRYNADLANGYGNLVSRVLAMVQKYFGGEIPCPPPQALIESIVEFEYDDNFEVLEVFKPGTADIENVIEHFTRYYSSLLDEGKFSIALEWILGLVRGTDGFITFRAPWKVASSDDLEQLREILYSAAASIRIITALLYPFMPKACGEAWTQLGLGNIELAARKGELSKLRWIALEPGTKLGPLSPIFPRADKGLAQIMSDMESSNSPQKTTPISTPEPSLTEDFSDIKPVEPPPTAADAGPRTASLPIENPGATVAGSHAITTERTGTPPHTEAPASGIFAAATQSPTISIDDFVKIDLRVAQIVVAERIPKADKLLRLEVDMGHERRQILSGIAEWYTPEELIGRRIAVIANLAPRKMRGLESHGMLLAASGEDHSSKPILATFSDEIALGSRIR